MKIFFTVLFGHWKKIFVISVLTALFGHLFWGDLHQESRFRHDLRQNIGAVQDSTYGNTEKPIRTIQRRRTSSVKPSRDG